MTILKTTGLRKSYQFGSETINVLNGIDLEVEKGTIITITGESGSGKSTLLNLIGGIDSPDSGAIEINGTDLNSLDEKELSVYRAKVIGFIFQFHFLLADFTALENIMMPAVIQGLSFKQAREKALSLINDVGLLNRQEHYMVNLSGGERQRIAVARSLMNDPELIIADEPTGNLDEKNSTVVENILFELVLKYQKTLILVTHDQELAGRGSIHYSIEGGLLKNHED